MIKNIIIALAFATLFSACQTKNLNAQLNYAKTFPTGVKIIANELTQEMGKKQERIVVTSLVDLNDFKESSNFGRLFCESLMTQMALRGYNVVEYRGNAIVTKVKKGEFKLNRAKVQELKSEDVFVLVGTYSKMDEKVIVNVRIINRETNILVAASSVYFPLRGSSSEKIIKRKVNHRVQLVPADCSKDDYCWKDLHE